jgi:ATP-dependent helicase/nuclease subunit A
LPALARQTMKQPSLFDDEGETPDTPPPDQAARTHAVDPARDVVLEASAGTGKTRVLVDRYVRLIGAGVDPRHILAITFTRKAAAEMRDRVLATLRQRAGRGELPAAVWQSLGDRVADIQISTIDAFCFGLLREFPLEADVDPAFEIADETEMARFANEALDLALRAARGLVGSDEPLRLLFARVKQPVLRSTVAALLDRRHIARAAIGRYVERQPRGETAAGVAAGFVARLAALLDGSAHRPALLEDGPAGSPEFQWLRADLANLAAVDANDPARVAQLRRRLERYFLTERRTARQRVAGRFPASAFSSPAAKKRHDAAVKALSGGVLQALDALEAGVNRLLARGLLRLFAIASDRYERLLAEHTLIDFAGMLARAVALLERQEEFARSRLKLQSRYHHLLLDEFQDTSRLQWRLVELLVDAWGEGEGAADAPTSIFVVGDRKQSIYRFRHAEATLLDEAARKITALRPDRGVRLAITHSFRAVPELLAFVNALAGSMQSEGELAERFTYGDTDRFPIPEADAAGRDRPPAVGIVAEPSMDRSAAAVAAQIERLLETGTVRDRTGPLRAVRPDDIAILFRARAGHQYFEEALEARGIRTYVYKGLGFFDAPEVQDLQALLRYLAQPDSDLRAAELLRSRLVRISDAALVRLAPSFAAALRAPAFDTGAAGLTGVDAALFERTRVSLGRWLPLADRLPPGELLDLILAESAYAYEMRGRRLDQARENLKKVRALVRRVENRGYATLGRLADYFETLRTGEESNAVVEASGCVSLMTIHAAKGLEFPVVFVVNLHVKGRGRAAGFQVIERGPAGEPEVAFGSSDATRLEDRREDEELRRLLYVAVTRARDRLYLATEVNSAGKPKRDHRSLAGLLPVTLIGAFEAAAHTGDGTVTWAGDQRPFILAVCRPHPDGARPVPVAMSASVASVDVTPVTVPGRRVASATTFEPTGREPDRADVGAGQRSGRLLGTVVHRLFQRQLDDRLDHAAVARIAGGLVRPEELVDVGDPVALATDAAAVYRRLRARPDVTGLLAAGQCHYEVPFSFEPPGRPDLLVRGAVDCVVVGADGRATVLEFKTGAPRPEHEAQAAVYLAALQSALPGMDLAVKILYP